MNNTVAIIGKPNVGKSSLFNKIVNSRTAIVFNQPGVTRDRLYEEASWSGQKFQIIDTGGIHLQKLPFQEQIKIQAQIAIEEAQIILFVIDGRVEITNEDRYVYNLLCKSNKKTLVVANKLEENKEIDSSIWNLGIKNIYPISAIHGTGVGDLLDVVITNINTNYENDDYKKSVKLTIIGRPNVGKSSLLNTLTLQNRALVSEIPGTTRDSLNAELQIGDTKFTIVDTAGISKKSKLVESVEHYALVRAKKSILQGDITLLVVDPTRNLAHFDAVVGSYAFQQFKPIILIVNKWDLAREHKFSQQEWNLLLKNTFKYLSWASIVYLSAKNNWKIDILKDIIIQINLQRKKIVKTSLLNEVISEIQLIQPPQSFKGGQLRIKFIQQIKSEIPTFLFWVNDLQYLHFSYKRFLEKQLRKYLSFDNVPLKLVFRATKKIKNNRKNKITIIQLVTFPFL